jgi:hypothetical protein
MFSSLRAADRNCWLSIYIRKKSPDARRLMFSWVHVFLSPCFLGSIPFHVLVIALFLLPHVVIAEYQVSGINSLRVVVDHLKEVVAY